MAGQRLHTPSLSAAALWVARQAALPVRRGVLHRDAHALLWGRKDAAVAAAEAAADAVLIDGMPLVWLLRAGGAAHAERVYGPDLMDAVCALTAGGPLRHAFLGGAPGVADALADCLTNRHPGLSVAGTLAPTVTERPDRTAPDSDLIAVIENLNADILWIGLGTPKQDLWLNTYRPHLRVPMMIASGAAFDLLSGRRRQAPKWVRHAGLEWAVRLVQEPRRLSGRYLRTLPVFAGLALWWWLTGAVRTER